MNEKLDEIISLLKEIKQALVGEKENTHFKPNLTDIRNYPGYTTGVQYYCGDRPPYTTTSAEDIGMATSNTTNEKNTT